MKRKHAILLTLSLVVLAGATYQLFKRTSLDFSKDEEPFRSMVMPLKEVMGSSYMDGGSVSLHVTDANGQEHDVTFPIDYYNLYDWHPTAYTGAFKDKKMVPMKNPARAKAIAIQLLKDFRCPVTNPAVEPFDANDHARRALIYPPPNLFDRTQRKVTRFLSDL
jgi:hypothetical protein